MERNIRTYWIWTSILAISNHKKTHYTIHVTVQCELWVKDKYSKNKPCMVFSPITSKNWYNSSSTDYKKKNVHSENSIFLKLSG